MYVIYSEYIGYIKSTEGPKSVGNNKTLFKGILGFTEGVEVKFICWDSAIDKHQSSLLRNNVVHFENAYCNKLNSNYASDSMLPFEFVFKEFTTITNLGHYDEAANIKHAVQVSYEKVTLKEILNVKSVNVEMECYLKTAIATQIYNANNTTSIKKFASITDGNCKLDVRFGFDIDEGAFSKGDALTVKGQIHNRGMFEIFKDTTIMCLIFRRLNLYSCSFSR